MEKIRFLYVIFEALNYSEKLDLTTLVVDEVTYSLKMQTGWGDKYCLTLDTTDEKL